MSGPPSLKGIHHVTAITADVRSNHHFYTHVLGMRLVKKTVNQDDTAAYHLFYADGVGSPGSDLTFFGWPAGSEARGTGAVTRTSLRVAGSLAFWSDRLSSHGITGSPREIDRRAVLDFEDPEGQRLRLVDDASGDARPYGASPVSGPEQIRGLGQVELSVPDPVQTALFLTRVLGMAELRTFSDAGVEVRVFGPEGVIGSAAELHLRAAAGTRARQGAGAVHHVAFRIDDGAYDAWVAHYRGAPSRLERACRPVLFPQPLCARAERHPDRDRDRRSRLPRRRTPRNDGARRSPLPPFLEPRRADIERNLKPMD